MKTYEVFSSRFDVSESRVNSFQSENDDLAMREFYRRYVANPNYAWDNLRLVEVVQERVERHVAVDDPKTRGK